MGSRRPLLVCSRRASAAITATLGCCLTCVLLLAAPVHALDPNKRLTQYIHTSWRIQDGSAPSGMYSVTQTADGFLWFASPRGDLYRFDGVRFAPWAFPAHASINRIQTVFGDHRGGLWVLGMDGIVHLKGGIVSSFLKLVGLNAAQNISEDPDGSLWVVRGGNAADEPLCHVTDLAVKCYGKADGIPISPIDAVLADGKDGLWLGGQTALVHWHAGLAETYWIEALKTNEGQSGIASLAPRPDGSLWVGMIVAGPGLGLGQFKEGTVKPFVTSTFDGSRVVVTRLIFDRDGSLWVGTAGNGLFRIRGTVVEHYGKAEGLSGDTVFALFQDREGMVWTGTTEGIDSFRDPAVTTFSRLQGLGSDAAVGILATRDGGIWIANTGSLDHIENGTVSSIRTGSGLPGHQVAAMLEDRAGNMWVGVDDGLYLFKNGNFRRIPEPSHQPLGFVVGIAEDVDGSIWAECAGKSRKLVRIRDFQVREEFSAPQVPPGHSLAADPQGGIWIGTVKGDIALFQNGVLERKFPVNLAGNSVADLILAQADGSVLAGSTDGLFGLRDGKAQRMTKKNGLPCNWVYSFVEDKEKRWWFYTECGVVELPDSELQRWWANPETIVQGRLYDVLDGARPSPPSFNSAAYSPDGRVWFATGVVVQMLDPSRLSQKALPAETYIESVIVDRKELAASENLSLAPHPRDLQIDYTSPTFLIPQRVRFRYRLDNYDRDWHDAGARRQAFYTDLPPGEYSFRVIGCNSDGVWDDTPARLDFSVTPAYYQTNWFRALCAVFFVALLWAAYQWRVRHLQHQFEITLEARVGERTRVARDLHDTLLQSFQALLPRLQAAIYRLPDGAVDARKTLEAVVDQAAEAVTEGRDAVQGLRMSTVEKNDLALAIRTVGEELASAETNHSSPNFKVVVEGTSRNLHPILRDEVYRVAAEALRNAFRHAAAQNVEAEIHYDEKYFRLRVRDDGKGIGPEVLRGDGREGHYGLHGMKERAKLVGGKLTIWSEVDGGTEIELIIPASRAYAKPTRGFWQFGKRSATDTDVEETIGRE